MKNGRANLFCNIYSCIRVLKIKVGLHQHEPLMTLHWMTWHWPHTKKQHSTNPKLGSPHPAQTGLPSALSLMPPAIASIDKYTPLKNIYVGCSIYNITLRVFMKQELREQFLQGHPGATPPLWGVLVGCGGQTPPLFNALMEAF